MNIIERQAIIENELFNLEDWDEKVLYLIKKGMSIKDYPSTHKTEENLIKECQAKSWLFCNYIDNKIIFFAHSETVIVRGIIAVFLEIYSDSSPKEIVSTPFTVFDKSGLSKILSNRNNGIKGIVQKVNLYAKQFI